MSPRHRLSGLVATVTLVALAVPAAARADTVTFLPTGGEQSFTVPAGVTSLHVAAVGGRGGTGQGGAGPGGHGALATGDLPVTPGQTLYIEVGGNGADGSAGGGGGFNGGGFGGAPSAGNKGGGGGGASDLRTVSISAGTSVAFRLFTAAGGGGGGGGTSMAGYGGAAGAAGGAGPNGAPGQPETLTTGGLGGGSAGCQGSDGVLGGGGAGGACPGGPGAFDNGGGGGGGVYGGGGGGASSAGNGGGGGSSGSDPAARNTTVSADTSGLPAISLSYSPAAPAPTAPTLPPAATPAPGAGTPAHLSPTLHVAITAVLVRRDGTLVVHARSNATGSVSVVATTVQRRRGARGRRGGTQTVNYGHGAAATGGAGSFTLTLAPSSAMKRLLARQRRLLVSIVVTLRAVTGGQDSQHRSVVVRLARSHRR